VSNIDWSATAAWGGLLWTIVWSLVLLLVGKHHHKQNQSVVNKAEQRAGDAEVRAEEAHSMAKEQLEIIRQAEWRGQALFEMERRRHERETEKLEHDAAAQLKAQEMRDWAEAIAGILKTAISDGIASNPAYTVRPTESEHARWAIEHELLRWGPGPLHQGVMLPTTVAGTRGR